MPMIHIDIAQYVTAEHFSKSQFHFAFDGQDFLVLQRNQSAWVPLAPGASNETRSWDAGHTWTQFARQFLREECVDTLRSLARGGAEALGQQELRARLSSSVTALPPGMSVTYRDTPRGAALSCHARGFYPRPIHLSWVRDGAEILPPMNSSGILPNADGTYQIWQSLEIPRQWGHGYACRAEHSSRGETTGKGANGGTRAGGRDVPCEPAPPRSGRSPWVRESEWRNPGGGAGMSPVSQRLPGMGAHHR
uniref:Ig-like domain-containing protein n=1 Tax=Chelydra serpentina TaxID=8475 RepID=A0A8C3SGH1_CHESE